jgi:N-acetylmuramoyl-L-alanine amidase
MPEAHMGSAELLYKSEGSARAGRGRLRLLLAFLALLLPMAAPLAQAALPSVLAVRVTTTPQRARLIVDLSSPSEFAIATLEGPERIAIDVKASKLDILEPAGVTGTGLVGDFSTVMAEDGRARTELTLTQPATVQQAYLLDPIAGQPARLVVDLIPTTEGDFEARAASDLANSQGGVAPSSSEAVATPGELRPTLPPPSSAFAAVAPPSSAAEDPTTVAALPYASAEPATPAATPLAPAALASGSRPLIVIDPGHGGIDNGASAPSGIHEKDITLAFALQLRDLLVGTGMFDVAMTRDDDSYLTLNERVDLARENRADLFISLHADTFQEADIRGASIYTRDERATDILDKVLADGENRSDIVAGYVQPDTKPAVVDILVDLMRRQVRQQAYIAAQDMVKAMQPSVALRRFPLRQADFFVLQAPDVPSMLIELGFMSNNADIANLENIDWRNKVVNAISQGVQDYFRDSGTIVASGG